MSEYVDTETGKIYGGDVLMNIGLNYNACKDFKSTIKVFKKK